MSYNCDIVADSINPWGDRLTSMLITVPRIILAEFNTHRMLSRNSASSRAIPLGKMIQSVKDRPFIPLRWQKQHPGMQGTEYISDPDTIDMLNSLWLEGRDFAVEKAQSIGMLGATKQLANRLLEPFAWHTILVTATEWENFTALRADVGADIHIQEIAYMILNELNESEPYPREAGQWHIPFMSTIEGQLAHEIGQYVVKMQLNPEEMLDMIDLLMVKVSVAKAAQTSYTVVGDEGKPMNLEHMLKLHDKLLAMGHVSPFEHAAQVPEHGARGLGRSGWYGNFKGWRQYRKTLLNENRKDSRLINKHDKVNRDS